MTIPIINTAEQPRDVLREAWEALLAPGAGERPDLFQRGGSLVEVHVNGSVRVQPVSTDRLHGLLIDRADWVRVSHAGNEFTTGPSRQLAGAMLADPSPAPALRAIVPAPVLTADGRVTRPGYDAASGIYCLSPREVRVSASPEYGEVRAARELVDAWLADFPFAAPCDKAHAVGLFLLPFGRELVRGLTPLHLVEKPTEGTGASLLVETALFPYLGETPAARPPAVTREEWRKELLADALNGTPVIYLDNLDAALDAAPLASALTAETVEGRLLGRSQIVRGYLRPVWVATGNNPVLSRELKRRAVPVRLDAGLERPSDRGGFAIPDLRGWVAAGRWELAEAALTLLRHWLAAAADAVPAAFALRDLLGSYGEWSTVVGNCLQLNGWGGFLEGREAFLAERVTAAEAGWAAFVARWREAIGGAVATTGELFQLEAGSVEPLLDLAGSSERAHQTSFGMQLARQDGRVYGGYRVTKAGDRRWRLAAPVGAERGRG